jgi:hypothetical protein
VITAFTENTTQFAKQLEQFNRNLNLPKSVKENWDGSQSREYKQTDVELASLGNLSDVAERNESHLSMTNLQSNHHSDQKKSVRGSLSQDSPGRSEGESRFSEQNLLGLVID